MTSACVRLLFCNVLFVLLGACGGGGNIGSKLDIPTPKTTPQISVFAGAVGRIGNNRIGSTDKANFYSGNSITVDKNGTIYVSDPSNCVIRKIVPDDIVITFAGRSRLQSSISCLYEDYADGPSSSAFFRNIAALAVGPTGVVYVADGFSNTVRAVSQTANVYTLAGRPYDGHGYIDANGFDARFKFPHGIAVDLSGNVYVADLGSGRVRKITPNRDVSTVTSFGNLPLSGFFNAITVDSMDNLYVVDQSAYAVYKINQREGNTVTTLDLGAGVAPLDSPRGVAVDSNGNVFVSDSKNHVIRKIPPTGKSTILAGEFGVAGVRDGFGTRARFFLPIGLATDALDNLYVADDNGTIRKITPAGLVTTIAGSATIFGSDDGIGSGATFGNEKGTDEASVGISVGNGKNGIAKDSQGNFYVADTDNHVIRKITPDQRVTTIAGQAGFKGSNDGRGNSARFSSPFGIVVDANDAIYITDTGNSTVRKISLDGSVTTFAGTALATGDADGSAALARFNHPKGLALDPQGFLVVADTSNHKLKKISRNGNVTTIPIPSSFGVENPISITADKSGNYYFSQVFCYCILKVDANGVASKLAGANRPGRMDGKGDTATFDRPLGLTVDDNGNLFVVDGGIRKITPDGTVTSLELDPKGYNLYTGNLVFKGTNAYVMVDSGLFQILNAR